ncbi:MAG: cupin domain-containing protein [Frankiaceae bacterium]
MPRTSKAEAPVVFDEPVIQSRAAELDGYTVVFESYSADVDPAPFFRGLPEDRCQCPHWGMVVSGRIVFRYPDHDEVFEAGDAYYGRPGHLPLVFAGSEVIEFSPTQQLKQTMDVVSRNLAAAGAPAGG